MTFLPALWFPQNAFDSPCHGSRGSWFWGPGLYQLYLFSTLDCLLLLQGRSNGLLHHLILILFHRGWHLRGCLFWKKIFSWKPSFVQKPTSLIAYEDLEPLVHDAFRGFNPPQQLLLNGGNQSNHLFLLRLHIWKFEVQIYYLRFLTSSPGSLLMKCSNSSSFSCSGNMARALFDSSSPAPFSSFAL